MSVFNNDIILTKSNFGTTFSLEKGSKDKYYKIKNNETGKYLHIDLTEQRSSESYFITLIPDKKTSMDFLLIFGIKYYLLNIIYSSKIPLKIIKSKNN